MKSPLDELLDFWYEFGLSSGPFVHPDDRNQVPTDNYSFNSFNDFCQKFFGKTGDPNLHLGLRPVPYIGNIRTAEIFILTLNPGVGPHDYLAEEHSDFTMTLSRNLRQEQDEKYPFMFLNPKYAWHGGFMYWHRQLRELIHCWHLNKCPKAYLDALSFFAKKIAVLELCAYHSQNKPRSFCSNIPSANKIRSFAQSLISEANLGNKLLIVARGAWGIEESKNVIVYNGYETHGARLGLNSRGGLAIANYLKLLR